MKQSFVTRLKQLWVPKAFRLPEPEFTKEQVDLLEELIQLIHPTLSRAEMAVKDDRVHMAHFLVDIGTGIWRIRRKIDNLGRMPKEIRDALFSLESTWKSMSEGGVEIVDHIGTIPSKNEAKIVEVRDIPNLAREQVVDAIKPTILLKGEVIQLGEVVMGRPAKAGEQDVQPESEPEPETTEPRSAFEPISPSVEEIDEDERPPAQAVETFEVELPNISHAPVTETQELEPAPDSVGEGENILPLVDEDDEIVDPAPESLEEIVEETTDEPLPKEAESTESELLDMIESGQPAVDVEAPLEEPAEEKVIEIEEEIAEEKTDEIPLEEPIEEEALTVESEPQEEPGPEEPAAEPFVEPTEPDLPEEEPTQEAEAVEIEPVVEPEPVEEPEAVEETILEETPEEEKTEEAPAESVETPEEQVMPEANDDEGFVRDVPTPLEMAIAAKEEAEAEKPKRKRTTKSAEPKPAKPEKEPKTAKAARRPRAKPAEPEIAEGEVPKPKRRTRKKAEDVTEVDNVG